MCVPYVSFISDVVDNEGNVLFNNALNTFYLQLYGVRHIVKDHSDNERKPAATWETHFTKKQGFFYMYHPTDRIIHTTVFVTPVMEHWLEQEITHWVHHEESIQRLTDNDFWYYKGGSYQKISYAKIYTKCSIRVEPWSLYVSFKKRMQYALNFTHTDVPE